MTIKKIILAFLFLILISSVLLSQEVKIRWVGHSCWIVTTSKGTVIMTDPFERGDYKIPQDIKPDIVTVTHLHMDHNMTDRVAGEPRIIRGLDPSNNQFVKIDEKIKDVHLYTVKSYHDTVKGEQRGLNAIFVYEFDGLRVAHLGDLGCLLDSDQLKQIGRIDILFIPVGGKYTISGEVADKVVTLINPHLLVLAMHYKTANADFLPYSAEDFCKGKKNVIRPGSNTYILNLKKLPRQLQYVILSYK